MTGNAWWSWYLSTSKRCWSVLSKEDHFTHFPKKWENNDDVRKNCKCPVKTQVVKYIVSFTCSKIYTISNGICRVEKKRRKYNLGNGSIYKEKPEHCVQGDTTSNRSINGSLHVHGELLFRGVSEEHIVNNSVNEVKRTEQFCIPGDRKTDPNPWSIGIFTHQCCHMSSELVKMNAQG